MPVALSLGVIVAILAVSIGASLWATRRAAGGDEQPSLPPQAESAEGAARAGAR